MKEIILPVLIVSAVGLFFGALLVLHQKSFTPRLMKRFKKYATLSPEQTAAAVAMHPVIAMHRQ